MRYLTVINAVVLFAIFSAIASIAHADGFFCEGEMTGLKITILNHNSPNAGTRSPESMAIVNPALSDQDQKLVTFTDSTQHLSYSGYGNFLGKIDQRLIETSRADALIAGVALKQLKSILVDIRFSYDPATAALARIAKSIPGRVSYTKKTGEVLEEKVTCKRYLKSARE